VDRLDLIFTVTEGDITEILSGTLNLEVARSRDGVAAGWSPLSPAFAQGLRDAITSTSTLVVALLAFVAGLVAAQLLKLRGRRTLLLLLIPALLAAPETVRAHEGHDHEEQKKAVAVTGDQSQRLSDGLLFVPKPIQRILAIRTLVSATSTHRKTLELPGRIIPDPNASGFVQASVSGRLSAPVAAFPSSVRPCRPAMYSPLLLRRFRLSRLRHAPEGRRARSTDRYRGQTRCPLRVPGEVSRARCRESTTMKPCSS
jgi:hypothetical protein